jgi:NAD(P)H-dependent FMN reductase
LKGPLAHVSIERHMKNIRIVCLSGSLRKASYNTTLIKAVHRLAPPETEVSLFEDMAIMPLFNPDLEGQPVPVVDGLRKALAGADGLLIASPEYAHGISGVLKNALDWLVSGEEFPYIPVALFNTSPRASHAQAALREVIRTMSGNIIEKASITVPLLGSHYTVEDIVSSPELSRTIVGAIHALRDAIIEHGPRAQRLP